MSTPRHLLTAAAVATHVAMTAVGRTAPRPQERCNRPPSGGDRDPSGGKFLCLIVGHVG